MIDIGSNRQLLVDRYFIDQEDNIQLKLHPPVRREIVWQPEKPWEGDGSWFPVVIKEGERYRMWYRTQGGSADMYEMAGYMESSDGILWERPNLGLIEFNGSKNNNLVWPIPGGKGANMSVFVDSNPAASPEERYKAIVRGRRDVGLLGLASADGLRWHTVQDTAIVPPPEDDPQFDSPNIAFWDPWRREYAIYARGWIMPPPEAITPDFPYAKPSHQRSRTIRRTTSADFRHWSPFQYLDLDFAIHPREQFYTNATVPYERTRNLYLMFPMRLILERRARAEWQEPGLSDITFLSSRDGIHWDRTFREAWLRPGLDQDNWYDRALAVGRNIIQTGPQELSLYITEHFHTPNRHFRRVTVRPDGFASVNAPLPGGEFTTPPLTFHGTQLTINFATSVLGTVRVELQDEAGHPLPGHTLVDCDEIFGDDLERIVTWQGNPALSVPDGQPVRLRFALSDADIYAFQFGDN